MTSAYTTAVLASSPAMYLKCDETTGTTLVDSSGNGHDGSINGGYTLADTVDAATPDDLGNHIRLDGTSGYIQLDSTNWFTPATSGFTFEAWVYVRGFVLDARFFDFANAPATSDMFFTVNTATPTLRTTVGGSSYSITYSLPRTARWHHLVYTVSSAGALNIYLNGSLYAKGTVGSPTNVARQFKYVGKSATTSNPYLSASVSHVAIYHSVLSTADIFAHYRASSPSGDYIRSVTADVPEAWWKLGETTGTFADSSKYTVTPSTLTGVPTTRGAPGPWTGPYAASVRFPNSTTVYTSSSTLSGPSLSTYTLEAWIQLNTMPAVTTSIATMGLSASSTASAGFNPLGMWVTTAGKVSLKCDATFSTATVTSTTTLTTGTWYHVVGSLGPNGVVTLRINKNNEGTTTVPNNPNTTGNKIWIHAGQGNGGGDIFISNVALYGGALLPELTDNHYDQANFSVLTGRTLDVNVLAANTSVAANWTSTFGIYDPITRYEYRVDGGATTTTPSATLPYDYFTGITNAGHTLEVRAVGSVSTSAWSTPDSFTSDASLTYHQEVLNDSPLAYVPFEESSGNYYSWPQGLTFTALPTDRTNAPITRNSTLSVSRQVASTQGIATSPYTVNATTPQTVEAWIKIPASTPSTNMNGTIAIIGAGTYYSVIINNGVLSYYTSSEASVATGYTFPVTAYDAVYQIVMVRSSTNILLYVNGDRAASLTTAVSTTAATTLNLGWRNTSTSLLDTSITLDSVSHYTAALSQPRIQAHLRAGVIHQAPSNLEAHPLDSGLFVVHDPAPGATRTDITLDGGTTYVVPNHAQTINGDHPAIYYRLGETTGTTANDSTPNARNGTYSGSYTLNQSSALSASLPDPDKSFYTPGGGTGGGVALAHASFPTTVAYGSAECWIKPDTVSLADGNGYKSILSKLNADQTASTAQWGWSLHAHGADLELVLNSSANAQTTLATTTGSLQASVWQHVAFTFDGNKARIYINGVEAAQVDITITLAAAASASFKVGINSQTARNFKGYIDEAAYYDYPCSPEQINKHYSAGLAQYFYTGILPSLTNGTSYDVQARVSNEYSGPSSLSAVTTQTPDSVDPLIYLDYFNRQACVAHPNHADYALDSYTLTTLPNFGINNRTLYSPAPLDGGTTHLLTVPGATNIDYSCTLLTNPGSNTAQIYGLVFREISTSLLWQYAAEDGYFDLIQGSIVTRSPTTPTTGVAGKRLRVIALNEILYGYIDGVFLMSIVDPQYPSTYLAKSLGFSFKQNYNIPRMDNAIAYQNLAPGMSFPPTYTAFLMKGRTTHALDAPTYEP